MKDSTIIRKKKTLIKAGTIVIWFLIWELLSLIISSDFLFPSPINVINRFFELAMTSDFRKACAFTILRIGFGCILGITFGLILGTITAFSEIIDTLFSPLLTIIKTTPVASFIILLLVWFSRTGVTIIVSFLLVTPIIWANANQAIRSVDKNLLEMANIYKLSKIKLVSKIYVPSVLPAVVSGITTSIGFSWKAGISAEIIAIPKNAIGTSLYYSKINLDYLDVFAWTVAIIVLSFLIEKVLVSLINKLSGRVIYGNHLN